MLRCGVLFELRTEFLNILHLIFGFKELTKTLQNVWFQFLDWIKLAQNRV
jgi:hypothetical protein